MKLKWANALAMVIGVTTEQVFGLRSVQFVRLEAVPLPTVIYRFEDASSAESPFQ